jgi:hypothetical protein
MKAKIFPYDHKTDLAQIGQWLGKLIEAGFVLPYAINGTTYLKLPTFLEHQSPHHTEKESRIPDPQPDDIIKDFSINGELTVKTRLTNESRTVSLHRSAIPHSVIRIQDSGNQESVAAIPLVGNQGEYPITQEMVDEWQKLFPAIDVMQVLNEIRAWNLANPKNRKTKSGVLRHITGWMTKQQNRAKGEGKQERWTPPDD